MKASKLIKGLVAASLLSSLFAGASARADHGYGPAAFADVDGGAMGYRHMDPDRNFYDRDYGSRMGHQVDRRQAAQWERIRHGLRTGDLTRREAAGLMAEQREIERLQQIYMADGRLTGHERHRLTAELDDASRHIWHEVRDAQDRDGYRRPW